MPEACRCDRPPCSRAVYSASAEATMQIVLLVVDFYLTRGFASEMQQQMRMVQGSVAVSQEIAWHLAKYQVERAAAALRDGAACLPEEMSTVLEHLIRNLEQYRPYLPMSCLHGLEEGASVDERHERCWSEVVDSLSANPPARSPSAPPMPPYPRLSTSAESMVSAPSVSSELPASEVSGNAPTMPPPRSPRGEADRTHSSIVIRKPASHRRVALVCANTVGFIGQLTKPLSALQEWMCGAVTRFEDAVVAAKGLIDLVAGDHFFASFNGLRKVGSYHAMAVECASCCADSQDGETTVTCSVVSGQAVCGDFGSRSTTRSMVLDGKCNVLWALDRFAARHRVSVLVDTSTCEAAEERWHFRICASVVLLPKMPAVPLVVWERRGERRGQGEEQEWMYQLFALERNPWNDFNLAMRKWIAGKPDTADMIARALQSSPGDKDVMEGLEDMGRRVALSATAPTVEIVEGLRAPCAGCPMLGNHLS
eukprot:TRINITY_DN17216_c0_g1_i1.p1 TRINITY_DN17216_c0_g1~~TRINITY_DN17216_c0_g1_i1.p1  ORF type:complete len:482 (+),score=82.63 TRINITY_DN17216_c0_g1_i1:598-2043(+)